MPLNDFFFLLIIWGKVISFQLEIKRVSGHYRSSLIGVIVSLQDKINRNKFLIFREVLW